VSKTWPQRYHGIWQDGNATLASRTKERIGKTVCLPGTLTAHDDPLTLERTRDLHGVLALGTDDGFDSLSPPTQEDRGEHEHEYTEADDG
jgi:hypothetical protein